MKYLSKLLLLLLVLSMALTSFAACELLGGEKDNGDKEGTSNNNEPAPFVDYVSTLKFNPASGRAYAEAEVHLFVDGDTTHFKVDTSKFSGETSIVTTGVLKARYLSVNTPESTGQVEPWGKKASNYTKTVLSNATSIILESDSAVWTPDSTGDRYLVWVWYKTAESDDYRNLNLELLQEGLSVSSKSSESNYGDLAVKIIAQAIAHKLNVHSREKDPDFYYGTAHPITLKELKLNIDKYKDQRVSFEGVVVRNSNNTAYIEEYDEESGAYFGISVYYGYTLQGNSQGTQILNEGNRVRIIGVAQYYETGGYYQVVDIKYNIMMPDHEDNILKLGSGFKPSYREVDIATIKSGKLDFEISSLDDASNETIETKTYDYSFIGLHSTVSLKNLKITDVDTQTTGSSVGAIYIDCVDDDGNEIVLRTNVLLNSDGTTVKEDAFPVGSTIDVKGILDVFDGNYQIKILSASDIVIK